MSDEATGIDLKKERKEWLRRLADELEKTEQFFPTAILPDETYPEWVRNLERELGSVLLPVVKVKDTGEMTPKRVGAIIGHSCAMAVWTMEWIFEEAKRSEIKAQNSTNEPDLKIEELPDKLRFDKWYSAMRRLAKRALCSSVDRTYEDMSEFLLGYSNAFARKPKSFKIGDMGNTTFEIYLFMLLFWGFVDRLESVSQLHQVFVKVFGPHRAGDLKRTEKICQRIGLRYRNRGRPRKSEIIQTLT